MHGFIYDSPIKNLSKDLFGWGSIAERISDAIKYRSSENHICYTIGIYGKWGEGKTSLMNMVCESLKGEKKIKIIHFNPWLFKDQESLLLDFFRALQSGGISKNFVEKIKQYGPLVSLGLSGLINVALPGLGSVVKGTLNEFTDAVSKIDIDIRKLKKEVNASIKESKKHILIVIDDVDRLDKDELHALFKLIRQNADFVNTTYMIAMDVEMVAKSIGQRFEGGDEQSGKNFLEKIIQVPIYLPKIQRGHLDKLFRAYLFPRIEAVLSDAGKSTTSLEEIKNSFYRYVSPLFRTVREVILYVNSLSMILPLVYRNVNISDLCLLEALKLFHPHGYHLIRQNKVYITRLDSKYQNLETLSESTETRQKKKDEFISKILDNVDSERLLYIARIVDTLFYPFMSSGNIMIYNLLNMKSICSPHYFDNYFLYTTPDNIISDVEIDRLIEDITTMSQDELTERFEFYYQKYGYDELTGVIEQIFYKKYFNNISNDCIELICVALSRLSVNKAKHKYNDPEIGLKFTQRFINPENRIQFTPGYIDPEIGIQVELTICNILNRYVVNDEKRRDGSIISDYEKQVDIIKTIFSEQELLPFHLFLAAHICEKCSVYNVEKEKVNSLVYDLINRYIDQNSIGAMFKLELTPTTVLFKIWKEMDPTGYREQIEQYTDSDEFDAVPFIQKMIDNSDINYYDQFCELFNADKMYDKVKNVDHDKIYDFTHTIGYFIQMHEEKSMSRGENSISPGENSMTPGEKSMTPGEKSISSGENVPV